MDRSSSRCRTDSDWEDKVRNHGNSRGHYQFGTGAGRTSHFGDAKLHAPAGHRHTLFFMWGFLTCLNDILVPHLKSIFDLSFAQVMLVQFAFFSAYFLFSVPWSKVVNRIGYQKTMVVGLLPWLLERCCSCPLPPLSPIRCS